MPLVIASVSVSACDAFGVVYSNGVGVDRAVLASCTLAALGRLRVWCMSPRRSYLDRALPARGIAGSFAVAWWTMKGMALRRRTEAVPEKCPPTQLSTLTADTAGTTARPEEGGLRPRAGPRV